MRQARYVGRAKTLGQVLLVVTVINLTLVATKMGLHGHRRLRGHALTIFCAPILALVVTVALSLLHWLDLTHRTRPSMAGFHPGF